MNPHMKTKAPVIPMETIRIDKPQTQTIAGNTGTFRVSDEGVFYAGFGKDGQPLPEKRICSKLEVLANTADATSNNHGVLLAWTDARQVKHQWAMPKGLLAGDAVDAVRPLYSGGLSIQAGRGTNQKIVEYIQSATPEQWLTCVTKTGWFQDVYITPHKIHGSKANQYILQTDTVNLNLAPSQKGTLTDWQAQISRYAIGNDRLIIAISNAFAGALMRFSDVDSGIIHFHGNSTDGKTTLLKCASSVLGSSDNMQLWKATANGLESIATQYNDSLLCLDELKQASPKEVGDIVYMLGNGRGKIRANKNGMTRDATTWQLLGLSTGELTLSDYLKSEGKEIYAGQELRLLNIPSDAGAGYGVFNTVHHFNSSSELANHLNAAIHQYYGIANDAWLDKITQDIDTLKHHIPTAINHFVDALGDISNQAKRAARRFALIAVAGELATDYGITGWIEGEATRACKALFAIWLTGFGTGNREEQHIYDAAVDFIQKNPNRFHLVFKPKDMDGKEFTHAEYQLNQTQYLHQRVGFQKEGVYYVLPNQLAELAKSSTYDKKHIVRVLKERGFFTECRAKPVRIPTFKNPIKLYEVSQEVFNAE